MQTKNIGNEREMARTFDGSTDKIVHSGTIISGHPYSFCGWGNSTSATAAQQLLGENDSTVDNEYTRVAFQGNVGGDPINCTSRDSGGVANASTSTGYTTGTWHCAGGVFASTTSRAAYIDGGSKGTDTEDISFATHNNFSIGVQERSSVTNFFAGDIACCGVWNVTLTDAEMAILAKGVNPFFFRNDALIAFYPIDGNDSPEAEFVSGNTGVLTGPPTKTADNPPVELLENYL